MLLTAFALLLAPPGYVDKPGADPNGIDRYYMGRQIARVMGHEGASWLDRPERDAEEATTLLISSLGLKPGMVVADVGAGSGTLSFPMARRVKSTGKVLAVEIQNEMLDMIRARSKRERVKNVVPVLGTTTDPKLPAGRVDLILMVDVYHELDRPYEMTANMVKALKPGGRLVLVEYRAEDDSVPIKEIHKMTVAQVRKEMGVFPLRFVRNDRRLPRQHVLIFRKGVAALKVK